MLFLGLGVVAVTLSIAVGGWVAYDQFFRNKDEDTSTATNEVPMVSSYNDEEWFQEPQANVQFLVEDHESIDGEKTLDAVSEWVAADEPNIWTGDVNVQVWAWNDAAVVSIDGDASTLIEETYEDVEVPYFTGDGVLEHVTLDLEFT